MSATIRLATPSDAEGCLAIYRPFVEQTAVSFETEVPTPAELSARIGDVLQRAPWLVCEAEGGIAGYAYATRYRPRQAYQWSVETTIYLAETARGRGFGRALYTNLLACLRRQGYVNAYAVITLPNPASVGLHEALGFRPLGVFESVGYKLDRWHDVGWWHLRIQPPPAQPHAPTPLAKLGELSWEQPADE
ncbi:MAG TPA: arsinothricin resistance N-acetyltransferase ArsN1 family B [bacterium]|nr:arsinothricin resistance N-acetyltransferase ArsN1 family B [bacterium]